MRYPAAWAKLNKYIALGAGAIILAIGFLAVFESVCRTFFNSPTVWTNDISLYIFIWAVFLGSAYAYQELGHVAVDLIRDVVEKFFGKLPRRIMSICGYALSAVTIIVLLYAAWQMLKRSIATNQVTIALIQIPTAIPDMAMIIGCVLMIVTLVFIILDIIAGGEKYI